MPYLNLERTNVGIVKRFCHESDSRLPLSGTDLKSDPTIRVYLEAPNNLKLLAGGIRGGLTPAPGSGADKCAGLPEPPLEVPHAARRAKAGDRGLARGLDLRAASVAPKLGQDRPMKVREPAPAFPGLPTTNDEQQD